MQGESRLSGKGNTQYSQRAIARKLIRNCNNSRTQSGDVVLQLRNGLFVELLPYAREDIPRAECERARRKLKRQ